MTTLPPVKVWFENGQLLTNRPDVFAKAFDMPNAAPVDGLTRVSHRVKEMRTRAPKDRKAVKP